MNPEFDRKLGLDFIKSVPDSSGVYLFRNREGEAVYVGKAKNLRKRLSQYRLANRKKAFRKMRTIVKESDSVEFQICDSEQAALLLENHWIQTLRPRLNVAGAFAFLYPYLGFKWDESQPKNLTFCYTTSPQLLMERGFELFGAFRSRDTALAAFDALAFLWCFIGHHTPSERKQYGKLPYTRILVYRQVPPEWRLWVQKFFQGESSDCLDRLIGELLEKPDARQLASEVQVHLRSLQHFYATEAVKLRRALDQQGMATSWIAQDQRDKLFLSLTGLG